jgi:hypothetical protein
MTEDEYREATTRWRVRSARQFKAEVWIVSACYAMLYLAIIGLYFK